MTRRRIPGRKHPPNNVWLRPECLIFLQGRLLRTIRNVISSDAKTFEIRTSGGPEISPNSRRRFREKTDTWDPPSEPDIKTSIPFFFSPPFRVWVRQAPRPVSVTIWLFFRKFDPFFGSVGFHLGWPRNRHFWPSGRQQGLVWGRRCLENGTNFASDGS